jgi:hypothetical protein
VRSALSTLPWVEGDSIKANVSIRQVKFTLKEKDKFDLEKIKEVLKTKGYSDVTVLTGPTT